MVQSDINGFVLKYFNEYSVGGKYYGYYRTDEPIRRFYHKEHSEFYILIFDDGELYQTDRDGDIFGIELETIFELSERFTSFAGEHICKIPRETEQAQGEAEIKPEKPSSTFLIYEQNYDMISFMEIIDEKDLEAYTLEYIKKFIDRSEETVPMRYVSHKLQDNGYMHMLFEHSSYGSNNKQIPGGVIHEGFNILDLEKMPVWKKN